MKPLQLKYDIVLPALKDLGDKYATDAGVNLVLATIAQESRFGCEHAGSDLEPEQDFFFRIAHACNPRFMIKAINRAFQNAALSLRKISALYATCYWKKIT